MRKAHHSQLGLFDTRATARQTSVRAWHDVKRHLSPARAAVYAAMCLACTEAGRPQTATEIAERVGKAGGRCVWKRVGELVQAGYAVESDTRECGVTGKSVLTYKPAAKEPSE